MTRLDDTDAIARLDSSQVLASVNCLPDQCKQAWRESFQLNIPQSYRNVKNIVVSGMGGSTYGGRIVKSLYDAAVSSKIPIELANNYWLPGYVNADSLVILSSYSGSTEETLACANQAVTRKAKILGLTSGGELAKFLQNAHYPGYIFTPVFNPSKQPRIGVGYMVMGLVGLLAKLKMIPVGTVEVNSLVGFLTKKNKNIGFDVPTKSNFAKQLALKLKDKLPIFIVADFLEGPAYAIRNPFHETSKQLGLYFSIPELNHHLLEGLSYPSNLKEFTTFIFVYSNIYDGRNLKRLKLTQEVIEKNLFKIETITMESDTALSQAMELIQLGAWITFYLALLNNVDPAKIPWVDFFKTKLKGDNYEI